MFIDRKRGLRRMFIDNEKIDRYPSNTPLAGETSC